MTTLLFLQLMQCKLHLQAPHHKQCTVLHERMHNSMSREMTTLPVQVVSCQSWGHRTMSRGQCVAFQGPPRDKTTLKIVDFYKFYPPDGDGRLLEWSAC
eukprot:1158318-Pelagomonas_calceolata.AAC.6